MTIKKNIRLYMVLFPTLLLCGCGNIEKTTIEEVIVTDLDQLKSLDVNTSQQYISAEDLFPDVVKIDGDSEYAQEFISLFFEDFDYKILDIDVADTTATASLRLNTLDSQTLAKDYTTKYLENKIILAANADNSTSKKNISDENPYELLNQLIKENDYKTVETNCTMELKKDGEQWEIQRTDTLENQLVGEFITYVTNPNLLSASETLDIYLSTFASMNQEEMIRFLGIEDLLDTDNFANDAVSEALIKQIQTCFSYKIHDTATDGYTATVNTNITTFDSDSILAAYNQKAEEYLKEPQALYDGAEGRLSQNQDFMIAAIEENKDQISSDIDITMINDGASWSLKNTTIIANAIFGDFTAVTEASQDNLNDSDSDSDWDYDSDDSSYDSGY